MRIAERIVSRNKQLTGHPAARYLPLVAALATFVLFVGYNGYRFGLDSVPGATGDEPSYDSLGWELSHGRGFQLNYADPQFRQPYDDAFAAKGPLYELSATEAHPIAYRPPLFPCVIAATDLLFGRQLWSVRLINIAAIAVVCGIVVHIVRQTTGPIPALCAGALYVVCDVRTRFYSRTILTEPFAALSVALLALVLLRIQQAPRKREIALAGLITGLALLNRTAFVLWLPGLAWIIAAQQTGDTPRILWKQRAQAVALFLGVTLAVASPWFIRNCVVLNAFYPLGTQGMLELSAGYSDTAVAHRGVWTNLDSIGFFDDLDDGGMSPLERETARAEFSRDRAFAWMRSNPQNVPLLMYWKVFQELRPREIGTGVVSFLALIGILLSRRAPTTRLLAALLLTALFAVALTWSVEGRFLVPLLVVFHVLAARGIWLVVTRREFSFFATTEDTESTEF